MNKNNLKERYIFAVTRHLPGRIQADVEQELNSLISDMLANSQNSNIEEVLEELGSPEELALKYYGSERKALISGVYFLMYKRVLLTVLPIVAVVMAVLTAVNNLFAGLDTVFIPALFLEVIAGSVGGVVQAFAVITIVFAILDYKKVGLNDGDTLHENLPDVPEVKNRISVSDAIFGIVFSIVTTALFLGFPQVMSGNFDGNWIPVFDIGLLRGLWLPIIVWAIVEIAVEVAKLAEGRYTKRLAVAGMVTAAVQVVCILAVFGGDSIVNPDFMYQINLLGYGLGEVNALFGIVNIASANTVAMVIMFIVLFFETLDLVVKGLRAH